MSNYNTIEKRDLGQFLRFKGGDEMGLAHIYAQFYKPLFKHGLRIVENEFAVDTIVQEAFLKAWAYRERMTSLFHTYRFMRLNVTWSCYDYYRDPTQKLHRNFIYTDNIDNYSGSYSASDDLEQPYQDEERLKTIYNVIPYLPVKQQTMLTLYFRYGLSYKQIARRFASTNQAVGNELQKGLDHLKRVIQAKKRIDGPTIPQNSTSVHNECLEGEMLQLFRLRYEMKLGFDVIAEKMNLSQGYIQQQYRLAHIRLQQLNKARK
jgi:RNA polymerase sigma factor (sigma-70 family)